MAFTGIDAARAAHVYYRATCSSPAVPMNSLPAGLNWQSVLASDGSHILTEQESTIPGQQPIGNLVTTDIATDTTTVAAPWQGDFTPSGLSAAPDGSAVAYKVDTADDDGVYVQPLNGDPAYRVSPPDATPGQWANVAPSTAWSHNGQYIAYPDTSGPGAARITWARADGSGVAGSVPFPGVSRSTALAWTPDDKGILTWDSTVNGEYGDSLLYIDLATGAATTVLAEPGRILLTVAVDQHWNVYLTSAGNGAYRMDAFWLGDPAKVITLPDVPDSNGGSYGPSVSIAGPADPAPAGFPIDVTATPEPTPPPAPTPTPTRRRRLLRCSQRAAPVACTAAG
jgi:hypothetical protein